MTKIMAIDDIVHQPAFETGIVKIINHQEATLTASQKHACKCFLLNNRAPPADVDDAAEEELDIVEEFEKRRKLNDQSGEFKSKYCSLLFIPTGSVRVESVFSTAMYVLSDHRRSTLPVNVEMQMYLKYNRRFWDEALVHMAMQDDMPAHAPDHADEIDDDPDM